MGQPVAVVHKPTSIPGVIRFEANRSLTGMGHEHYASIAEATGDRPAAVLARRMFATGHVGGVHIFANQITVDLAKGYDAGRLDEIVRDLYQYWKPGMEPPVFEDVAPEEPAAAAVGAGDTGGGSDPWTEAAKKVPQHLLDRSRAARDRWKSANAG
jgi:hypothetical protein